MVRPTWGRHCGPRGRSVNGLAQNALRTAFKCIPCNDLPAEVKADRLRSPAGSLGKYDGSAERLVTCAAHASKFFARAAFQTSEEGHRSDSTHSPQRGRRAMQTWRP